MSTCPFHAAGGSFHMSGGSLRMSTCPVYECFCPFHLPIYTVKSKKYEGHLSNDHSGLLSQVSLKYHGDSLQ